MANIHKGKGYMKTSLNDITKGKSDNKFFMGDTKDKAPEKLVTTINLDALDQEIEMSLSYNSSLKHIDEMYSNIQPMHGNVLVRAFVRVPEKKNGFYVGSSLSYMDYIAFAYRGASGQAYPDAQAISKANPWKFLPQGIVVASGNENFKVGNIVTIPEVRTMAPVTGAKDKITHDFAFVHPDNGMFDPPQTIGNRHYGYIMLDAFNIKAKLYENYEQYEEYQSKRSDNQ